VHLFEGGQEIHIFWTPERAEACISCIQCATQSVSYIHLMLTPRPSSGSRSRLEGWADCVARVSVRVFPCAGRFRSARDGSRNRALLYHYTNILCYVDLLAGPRLAIKHVERLRGVDDLMLRAWSIILSDRSFYYL